MHDRTVGCSLVILSLTFSVYYTVWVIGLPFFDEDHFIHQLFPPLYFALLIPALMGLAFIGSLIIFCVVELKGAKVTATEHSS